MDIQIAVVCDAATDSNGRLNLLGAFDTIHAAQLPVVHPHCSIVLRMTFSKVEEGEHKLRLNFVDEDGKSIMQGTHLPDLPFQVRVTDDTLFMTTNFIVSIQQLRFDKAGHYSIDVAVDGRQEASIPLLVKTVTVKA
ncbi:MAG TPA: hypothetical protein VH413_18775 [Verrucomicrobiae bacterium]|jgi:hypothetical protein|nr:hypothetical protein [Verrucomicrobiae bacterium]